MQWHWMILLPVSIWSVLFVFFSISFLSVWKPYGMMLMLSTLG